jgi:AraC-like DNA-binding protein
MQTGARASDNRLVRPRKPVPGEAHFWVRTLLPFARFFSAFPAADPLFAELRQRDPDDRMSANQVRAILLQAATATGEWAAGLKVGRTMQHGEAGVIDYVASSASTLAEALTVAARNFRLVNEALSLRVLCDGASAIVCIDSRMPWELMMSDALLAALFSNHLRSQLSDLEQLEVCFGHEPPPYRSQYERTFAPARLRFSAAFYGFRLPIAELERPLAKADPYLHQVLRKHVAQVMSELPSSTGFRERVAALIADLLPNASPPSAAIVAARLGVSTRTLARRLEAESVTFYDILDGVRRRLAIEYVANTQRPLRDVGVQLGFAHAAAFHRAFRRWTGQAPGAFRRARAAAV